MMKQFLDNSYLFGGNAPFVEDLYESYLDNPQSVPERVARVLRPAAGPAGRRGDGEGRGARAGRRVVRAAREAGRRCARAATPTEPIAERKQVYVAAARSPPTAFTGSRWADLDPLKRQQRPHIPELEPGVLRPRPRPTWSTVFNTGIAASARSARRCARS